MNGLIFYFIRKDRYLKKVPYSEYLPLDFDARLTFADQASYNANNNNNCLKVPNTIMSHKTRTSTSIYSQDNEVISSEDDEEITYRTRSSK